MWRSGDFFFVAILIAYIFPKMYKLGWDQGVNFDCGGCRCGD